MRKWDGLLARMGEQLSHFQGNELNSVITTAARHLRFLSSPAMVANTIKSSFDPNEITQPGTTTFFVLPPDKLASHAAWLRLHVGSVLRQIARGGLRQDAGFHLIAEEAAALGRMESLENALTQLRGYGLKITLVYQALNQIDKAWPDQRQTCLSNADLQIYIGANEWEGAETISKMLGDETQQLRSQSGGWNEGCNIDNHGTQGSSFGVNGGWNVSETARRLLKPEEIMQLPAGQAIVFSPGTPPLLTTLIPAYSSEFKNRKKPLSPATLVMNCVCLAIASVSVMALAVIASHPR